MPGRIFLDTNVLQYLQDFGEYIFDNYRESKDYFITSKGKIISKNNSLYKQIIALHDIFININRTNIEFALSQSVFDEVKRKKRGNQVDISFIQWFYDVWDHWQAVLQSYKDDPISDEALERYKKAQIDKSLFGCLSEKDRKIILDAIYLDCDALLTVDKFARQNFQYFVYREYQLMAIKPTGLVEILKPFQALWI